MHQDRQAKSAPLARRLSPSASLSTLGATVASSEEAEVEPVLRRLLVE
jgi:hypothetical protein